MSTIGSVGSYASSYASSYANSQASSTASTQRSHRPDPGKMAEALFSQLDTKGQGYIEKSDLQSAFDQTATSSSTSSASVDQVFSQLDGNGDGKVSQDEMSSSLSKLASELDSQFNQMRMSGGMHGMSGMGGAGGMPPPPPPGDDQGFTQDQLSSQLDQIGSSDSQRSALISKIVGNFKAADADSDGKVSFKEAMAYDQSTSSASSNSNSSATTATTNSSDSTGNDLAIMKRMMDLMQTYRSSNTDTTSSLLSTLSVSA